MTDRDFLHDFALACRYATLDLGFQVNNCIMVTRLGIDVLKNFGVEARPQPVVVYAFNRKAFLLKEQGVPISQWPEDAWSVGVGPMNADEASAGGWDGHLVLILKNQDRTRTLIDLSADQLDRPARHILVGGPLIMDIAPGAMWTPRDPIGSITAKDTDNPTAVQYMPLPKAAAGDWQSAPDWRGSKPIHDELVRQVTKALREKHPETPA